MQDCNCLPNWRDFVFPVNFQIKTAGRVPQTPYSFDGPKEYAEKGLALRWALSGARVGVLHACA